MKKLTRFQRFDRNENELVVLYYNAQNGMQIIGIIPPYITAKLIPNFEFIIPN